MKITIEHVDVKCTIETPPGLVTWRELLPYIQGALEGVGFKFNGELDIVNDNEESEGDKDEG